MGSKIQYHHLLRLVRHQQTALPSRFFPISPSIPLSRYQRLQPFSTSLGTWQEQRQEPGRYSASGRSGSDSPANTAPATSLSSSTIPPPSPSTTPPSPPQTPDPSLPSENEQQHEQQAGAENKKDKSSRSGRGRLFLALASTLIGLSLGSAVRLLLSPPNPPEPNSEEDEYAVRIIREQAARLPIVQQMMGDPEQWEWWDAYESLPAEHRAQHISATALAGARGVGAYQRVFCHRRTGELVSVIHFGSATAGWPGVVHGGCLATILDESCGRAAFRAPDWAGRVGVTARLTLEYKRPTLTNNFYVVRARARPEEALPESERGKRHYKCWIDATMEDARSGAVTVTAEALFVGGKGNGGKSKKVPPPLGNDEEGRRKHLRF